MEPSVQSKAKIALGKADKTVSWTISVAHRFAKDILRRVEQEGGAFYVAGESIFTDALLIVALLLAFIIVFLLGYSLGARCGRRVVHYTTKAVCSGEITAAADQRVTGNGGKEDGKKPAAAYGGEPFTDNGGKEQSADDAVK